MIAEEYLKSHAVLDLNREFGTPMAFDRLPMIRETAYGAGLWVVQQSKAWISIQLRDDGGAPEWHYPLVFIRQTKCRSPNGREGCGSGLKGCYVEDDGNGKLVCAFCGGGPRYEVSDLGDGFRALALRAGEIPSGGNLFDVACLRSEIENQAIMFEFSSKPIILRGRDNSKRLSTTYGAGGHVSSRGFDKNGRRRAVSAELLPLAIVSVMLASNRIATLETT